MLLVEETGVPEENHLPTIPHARDSSVFSPRHADVEGYGSEVGD